GEVVVEDGELRRAVEGKTFWVAPAYDDAIVDRIRSHFADHYTVQFENYPVDLHFLPQHEVIPCT
ncbi:MAG TPA: hypothetical protein VD902_02705, partial [Symbiobacteriaceae bacterium]|nr:hypothetical protein [Symbiobacteriaceae bacterium]